MRIGIVAEGFTHLIGANDFFMHLANALKIVSQENNVKLFLIGKKNKSDCKIFKKIYKIILSKLGIGKEDHLTLDLTFINFNESLKHIADKYKLDLLLPCVDPNNFNDKNIGYLYDCQHKYYPEFFSEAIIQARNEFFQAMLYNYKKIIVNANTVKNDLEKFYDASKTKIYVLPFTPKIDNKYIKDLSSDLDKYKLPQKYFLMSNQFWIHKDHPTAFRAFAEFLKRCPDYHFVFTGTMQDERKPEYIEELKELICSLGITDHIHLLGVVPKAEQLAIMKGAAALVQTTLYEGGPGGGSVMDALAMGVPCIVSNIETNLEIKSDRVTFFEVRNSHDLSQKMYEVCQKKYIRYDINEIREKSHENYVLLGNFLLDLIRE